MIRRSGENISAVEVEEVLMEMSEVAGVGVTAVPDDIRGDEVCALVVTEAPAAELAEDLLEHCLSRLAYYKAPGYVAVIDQLPLTATEKVQRAALKQLAAELVLKGECYDLRERKRAR